MYVWVCMCSACCCGALSFPVNTNLQPRAGRGAIVMCFLCSVLYLFVLLLFSELHDMTTEHYGGHGVTVLLSKVFLFPGSPSTIVM